MLTLASNNPEQLEFIDYLFNKGADPNIADLNGETPLLFSLKTLRPNSEKLLILLL